MSLVDYDSSSEEEDDRNTIRAEVRGEKKLVLTSAAQPQVSSLNQRSTSSSRKKEDFTKESGPVALKLPDAALLLSSPALASDIAPVTESALKKRDLSNQPSSSDYARRKIPKGNLPHTKRVPDTVAGNLIPPQLTGRSNVVTEDISKLFVKRSNVVTEDISKLFVKRQADSSLG